jgi:hypothetical protein
MADIHPKLLTVADFARECGGWPDESALRWLLFNRQTNGFDKVVRRVGRRILISVEAYYEWIEERNQQGYKSKGGR